VSLLNRDNNLFSFYLDTAKDSKGIFDNYVKFGKYWLSYSTRTSINKDTNRDSELIILGDAIDLQIGDSLNLASLLLANVSDIRSLIENEYYIGGKYVIFYRCNNVYYILGDATCSIPIYYTNLKENGFVCASNIWDIATCHSLIKNEYLLRIRNSGDISQAMPYDYTVYKEVKQLLPNHYLVVESDKPAVYRSIIQSEHKSNITPKEAAEKTAFWIKTLAEYYMDKYDVCCPITAGRDSRVVLAFLKNIKVNVPCYTIKHESHTGKEQDLIIPIELCKKVGMSYNQIASIDPSDEMKKEVDDILGPGMYSDRTLKIANTVQAFCKGRAIINGDIIGQVGKCSLHRDIPQVLATPSYFLCKLHNYSKEAKIALKEWLDEIKKSNEHVSTFDLFSIENRMGRWAAQENLIYNIIGQYYLNIFNSKCIIYMWTRVPRKKRKVSLIHIELIKLIDESLLEIPFEFDESIAVRLAKSTGIAYYCASFLKHWVERLKFKKARRENNDEVANYYC
jgi:hypothetical protein